MLTASTAWDNEWQEIPGPEAVIIGVVQNPKLLPIQGKTLADVAKLWNKDPMDALFDLLIEDQAYTRVAVFGMSEDDVALALQQPWTSVCNDSSGASTEGLLGQEHPHPRAYGTFPRILRKYVREEKKLVLEDAIRKFSALPAQRVRLTDRGVLKEGMWADIVVFDPATIKDVATFADPNQLSQGMQYVLVNGGLVIDQGEDDRDLNREGAQRAGVTNHNLRGHGANTENQGYLSVACSLSLCFSIPPCSRCPLW